jgi:uncharacterized protein YnzC (UPF0291/DUF896 family)
MEKGKIEKINFLARKSKSEELTDEEKKEQTALRDEYRKECKNYFYKTLDKTYVIDETGKKQKFFKGNKVDG